MPMKPTLCAVRQLLALVALDVTSVVPVAAQPVADQLECYTFGVLPPPQVSGAGHQPQSSMPPHPSELGRLRPPLTAAVPPAETPGWSLLVRRLTFPPPRCRGAHVSGW